MAPPFLTASLSRASAAVEPWPPTWPTPISSRMRATLSPSAGVGARDRSMMPNGMPSRLAAVRPTSSPARVILKAVERIAAVSLPKSTGPAACTAFSTTPGPETPTCTTASPSLTPWKAPAMKGLSSTALQNTTSLAQPIEPWSAVRAAVRLIARPISAMASMLSPARVEPMLIEEQTRLVAARASGRALIRAWSEGVMPFSTWAEKPPMKSMPRVSAARSSAWAILTKSSGAVRPATSDTGVTDTR